MMHRSRPTGLLEKTGSFSTTFTIGLPAKTITMQTARSTAKKMSPDLRAPLLGLIRAAAAMSTTVAAPR